MHKTDGSTTRLPVTQEPEHLRKGVLGMLAQACFAVPPDGSHGPTVSECEIFLAEDKTKIELIGPGARRADGRYFGFSDIGAPEGYVFQLQPTILKASEVPMLQLADIAAYMCSHMFGTSETDLFLQEQLARIRYWSRARF